MISDTRPNFVTSAATAAIDSNRYADPIKSNGRWVEQIKLGSGSFNGPGNDGVRISRLATANGMLVFLAAWSGGGSGTFYYLRYILDAPLSKSSVRRGRLDLFAPRPDPGAHLRPRRPLAGRREHLRVVTNSSLGGHGVVSVTIDARRP